MSPPKPKLPVSDSHRHGEAKIHSTYIYALSGQPCTIHKTGRRVASIDGPSLPSTSDEGSRHEWLWMLTPEGLSWVMWGRRKECRDWRVGREDDDAILGGGGVVVVVVVVEHNH